MVLKRIVAVLRLRCPVCLQGKLFRSLFGMHERCPHCGVLYEREPGYYLNSMFVAYTIGFLVLVPSALLLAWWYVSVLTFTVVIAVEAIIIWPIIFRYSRAIWLHLDQVLDPRTPPITDVDGAADGAASHTATEPEG